MTKKIFLILGFEFILGCTQPSTRREFDQFAPLNLKKINFEIKSSLSVAVNRLKEISVQCLNQTWSINYKGGMNGRMAQPGGTAHIYYHAAVEETDTGVSLYLQKDIPSSVSAPEGGYFGMLVKLQSAPRTSVVSGTIYYFDQMGIRFRKIAEATHDRLVSGNRICSDLNTDSD